jgi:hypothetical protein
MTHRWPCSPGSFGVPAIELGEVPFLSLRRCGYCGALWTFADRSIHRVSVDVAESTFGIEIPVFSWAEPAQPTEPIESTQSTESSERRGADSVRAIHAQFNGDALYRMVLTTDEQSWEVRERGALIPSAHVSTDGIVLVDADEAVELAQATWGPSAGAVLRLGLETNLDQGVLRALDHIQALPVEDWTTAWQPRAAAFAEILRVHGPDRTTRIRAAIEAAIHEGVTSSHDLRVAGFID